jgi:hypothetical protein
MLSRLAELAPRHPRRMAVGALVRFVVAGVIGGPAAGAFKATNPFADPHSDSARAEQTLKRLTGAEIAPGVLALVSAPPGSPAVSSVVRTIAAQPDVASATVPTAGLPSPLVLMAPRLRRTAPAPAGTGRWFALAQFVMRRRWIVAIGTAALLLVIASPTPGVHWSGIDATVLPTSQSARVVQDRLARDFPGLGGGQVIGVLATAPPAAGADLAGYAQRLRAIPGVGSVAPPRQLGADHWYLKLTGTADAISAAGQRAVAAARAVHASVPVIVGGPAADFTDLRSSIGASLPVALALLVIVTLVVLWVMTGSVVLPLKTLLMNVLTTAAATGLLVFVFQDGRLTGPLAYTSQHGIEETDFLILAAVVFALSTDYGVFLLSRIKEIRDGGADDTRGRGGWTRAHRTPRHSRVADAGRGYRRVRHLQSRVPQGGRSRDGRRGADRRLHRQGAARPLADGAARPLELVVSHAARQAPRTLRPVRCVKSSTDRCRRRRAESASPLGRHGDSAISPGTRPCARRGAPRTQRSAFGVRLSRNEWYGATNGSGAITV